ncbi:MAG: hypothetical protein ABIK49_05500 [candidate division WOR-3 bacterium]
MAYEPGGRINERRTLLLPGYSSSGSGPIIFNCTGLNIARRS